MTIRKGNIAPCDDARGVAMAGASDMAREPPTDDDDGRDYPEPSRGNELNN